MRSPFPVWCSSRRAALQALSGKARKLKKAGTGGRRTMRSYRKRGRPFSSRPELSRGWPYRAFRQKGKHLGLPGGSGRTGGSGHAAPQEVGELDGELDPFADLVGARRVMGGALQLAELGEQELQAFGQELPAEIGVLACPGEIGIADEQGFVHVAVSRSFGSRPVRG